MHPKRIRPFISFDCPLQACSDIFMSYGTRAGGADYRRHMASQFMQCTVGGAGVGAE